MIDRTEAMTVIDVNTGKFTGSGGNLEETVTRNNLEAAEEVVRQLRLRDIGGIIVIDFIDMVLEANRDLVLRRLTECLARDRTRHQVAEVTSLGLVQMTRKRVGGGLLEHFSTPCEHCRGRGVVVNAEPIAEPDPGRAADRARARPSGSRGGVPGAAGAATPVRRATATPSATPGATSGRRNGSTRNGSPMDVATRTGLDGADRGARSRRSAVDRPTRSGGRARPSRRRAPLDARRSRTSADAAPVADAGGRPGRGRHRRGRRCDRRRGGRRRGDRGRAVAGRASAGAGRRGRSPGLPSRRNGRSDATPAAPRPGHPHRGRTRADQR